MTDGTPTHTTCGTTLTLNEWGPLYNCPKCGVQVGIEETGEYTHE